MRMNTALLIATVTLGACVASEDDVVELTQEATGTPPLLSYKVSKFGPQGDCWRVVQYTQQSAGQTPIAGAYVDLCAPAAQLGKATPLTGRVTFYRGQGQPFAFDADTSTSYGLAGMAQVYTFVLNQHSVPARYNSQVARYVAFLGTTTLDPPTGPGFLPSGVSLSSQDIDTLNQLISVVKKTDPSAVHAESWMNCLGNALKAVASVATCAGKSGFGCLAAVADNLKYFASPCSAGPFCQVTGGASNFFLGSGESCCGAPTDSVISGVAQNGQTCCFDGGAKKPMTVANPGEQCCASTLAGKTAVGQQCCGNGAIANVGESCCGTGEVAKAGEICCPGQPGGKAAADSGVICRCGVVFWSAYIPQPDGNRCCGDPMLTTSKIQKPGYGCKKNFCGAPAFVHQLPSWACSNNNGGCGQCSVTDCGYPNNKCEADDQ